MGIEQPLEDRMNAKFLLVYFKTCQHKYQQNEKCLPLGTLLQATILTSVTS
jgi:hypothetical protein